MPYRYNPFTSALDYYILATLSGVNHSELSNLGYASSGHTGFAPISHNHVESSITDLDKYTQSEVDTISGSLNDKITAENLWDRTGTTLTPHNLGDDIDFGAGTISGTGEVVDTHYETIYIDAAVMLPCMDSGALAGTYEYGTNAINIDYFAFDSGSTEERVQFKYSMPEGWDRGTIKAKFYWSSDTGSTAGDTCQWGIKGQACTNNDAIDVAFGDGGEVIGDVLLADNGTDWQLSSATPAITIGGSPALDDIVVFEIWRDTSVDNMAEDGWLMGIGIQFKVNNSVSAW